MKNTVREQLNERERGQREQILLLLLDFVHRWQEKN